MRDYDKRRKLKRELSQHTVIKRKDMKMPEKNIPVIIRPGLIVYVRHVSQVESTKLKYAGK